MGLLGPAACQTTRRENARSTGVRGMMSEAAWHTAQHEMLEARKGEVP